jgi:HD superfamily phosphohydrolase
MQKPLIIHDPVHKTIILDEFEQMLLNTRHVQRLRNIQQLGLVDYVYPGANHTRFEHSIGTMHMASVIGEALSLEEEDIRKIRIAVFCTMWATLHIHMQLRMFSSAILSCSQ